MSAEKIIEFDKVVAGYSPSLTILNETTLDARRGEIVRHVLEKDMVPALMEEMANWEAEEAAKGTLKTGGVQIQGAVQEAKPHFAEPVDPSRIALPLAR